MNLTEDEKRIIAEINQKLAVKYFLDKCFAFILLYISIPFIVLISILIILEGLIIRKNWGPIFVSEPRFSQGEIVSFYKFRTVPMEVIRWIREQPESRSMSTTRKGRTYIGKWILSWYLDEIPQFWTILTGQMSIVGPRPKPMEHYQKGLEEGALYRTYLRGGLLGFSQSSKKNNHYKALFRKIAKQDESKGAENFADDLDRFYLETVRTKPVYQILKMDLLIIGMGIITVFKGEHNWLLPLLKRKLK